MLFFGQKLLNTWCSVGRCAHLLLIMKWGNALSLQKNSLELKAASHKPAGTLIQMGSWNAHLTREACSVRGLSSRR